MSALEPKLSVVFDAIRDALVRVADDEVGPRLEALGREIAEDRVLVRHEAAAEHDSALAAVKAEADGRIASLVEQARYLEARLTDLDQMWRAATAERDALTAAAQSARSLATALQRLDACTTITECLDACAAGLADLAPRSAVLVPRGASWQLWRAQGFSGPNAVAADGSSRPHLPPLVAADELAAAGASTALSPDRLRTDGATFIDPVPGAPGQLWTIGVGGAVGVLVYADGGAAGRTPSPAHHEWATLVPRVLAMTRLALEAIASSAVLKGAGVLVSRGASRASA